MNPAASSTSPDRILIRSAWISLLLSIVVLAIKFFGYYATHSQSVLSDAIESIVNVMTAAVALFVMKAVSEPADDKHPYGHGKLEFFSAAFEGGLIFFASVAIIYSATESFWSGSHPTGFDVGLWAMGIATLINIALGARLLFVAKKYKSEALLASSKHVFSDVVTTAGVFIGFLLVKLTGWMWLDETVALLVGCLLAVQGFRIIRYSAGALIDETDGKSVLNLTKAFHKHRPAGFIDIHKVKVIRSGRFHHIDAHLVVPEFWTILQAHNLSHQFEQMALKDYPFEGEIAFHLDPCKREFCRTCALEPCGIRQHPMLRQRTYEGFDLIKSVRTDDDFLRG